jgi:hypothetical protein
MSEPTPRLLLPGREAARVLSISERLLWSLTAPRGPIACVRLGRRVLYPVASLEAFIASQQQKGGVT